MLSWWIRNWTACACQLARLPECHSLLLQESKVKITSANSTKKNLVPGVRKLTDDEQPKCKQDGVALSSDSAGNLSSADVGDFHIWTPQHLVYCEKSGHLLNLNVRCNLVQGGVANF